MGSSSRNVELEQLDDEEVLFELMGLEESGVDSSEIESFIDENVAINGEAGPNFIRNLPTASEQKERYREKVNAYTQNTPVRVGQYTCRNCKGKNTTYSNKQLRANDEGESVIIRCKDCGNKDVIM